MEAPDKLKGRLTPEVKEREPSNSDQKDSKETALAAKMQAFESNHQVNNFLTKKSCYVLASNIIREYQKTLINRIKETLTHILNASDEELIVFIFQLLRDTVINRLLKHKLRDLYLYNSYAQYSLNSKLQERLRKAFGNKEGIENCPTHAFYEFCKVTVAEQGEFEELIQEYQDEFRLIFENVPVEALAKFLSIFNGTFVAHLILSMHTINTNNPWLNAIIPDVSEEVIFSKTGYAYTGLTLLQKSVQDTASAKGLKLYHVQKVRELFGIVDVSPIIINYLADYFKAKIKPEGHPLDDNRKIIHKLSLTIFEEIIEMNYFIKENGQLDLSNANISLNEPLEPNDAASILEINKQFGLEKLPEGNSLTVPRGETKVSETVQYFGLEKIPESNPLTAEQSQEYIEVLIYFQDPKNVRRQLQCVKQFNYRAWAAMLGTSGLFSALNYRGIGSSIEKIAKLYRVKGRRFEPAAVGFDALAIMAGLTRGLHDIRHPNHPPNLFLRITDGINTGFTALAFWLNGIIHVYIAFSPDTQDISDELFYGGFLVAPAVLSILLGIWKGTTPAPNEERHCCKGCDCFSCCCNCSNKTKDKIDIAANTIFYSRIIETLASNFFSIKNNYPLQIAPFFVGAAFVVLERRSKTSEIASTSMKILSAAAFGAEVVLALMTNGVTLWGWARIMCWLNGLFISSLITVREHTEYVIVYDGDRNIAAVTQRLKSNDHDLELAHPLLPMEVKQNFENLEGYLAEHNGLVNLQERQGLAIRMEEYRQKTIRKRLEAMGKLQANSPQSPEPVLDPKDAEMLKISHGVKMPDAVIYRSEDSAEQVQKEAEQSLVTYYMRYRFAENKKPTVPKAQIQPQQQQTQPQPQKRKSKCPNFCRLM